jgi:transcriptional regulator with XRE-family HTH domain
MTQAEFAAKAGAGRASQANYEGNKRRPDTAYLAAISEVGADVLYIVTGCRSVLLPLRQDEAALLDNYRHCEEGARKSIREVSAAFAQQGDRRARND